MLPFSEGEPGSLGHGKPCIVILIGSMYGLNLPTFSQKKNQPFHGSVNIPVRSSHGIRHGIGCELGTSMAPQKVGCLHRTDH